MKISGFRAFIITLLILLIPIYGNWKLLLHGNLTQGEVTRIYKENMGQIFSYYSIIQYRIDGKTYEIRGPENVEYPIGKNFSIRYLPSDPNDAIIYNFTGIYFNHLTAFALTFFILWMAFYLSFTPKNENRKSQKKPFSFKEKFYRKELDQ